jgi:O-antigen/teichoic acid export membrane protein
MVVSLFTVRIVLKTLGITDYGIYGVVGGIVEMFSFLSNTMASASERFFAFELGKNNLIKLKRTFSLTIVIYAIISIIILLLAETIGLWFLNNRMVIPIERIGAANWIYQFSILSFIVTIMTIPYNAIIIARENMKFYAYASIIEVVLKLAIVYALTWFAYDKLKLYGFLILMTTLIVTFLYRIVCKRRYDESHFHFYWNRDLFKVLMSYSGWNLFGAITGVANNQGTNILLNVFFGPVVNAARAIAYRVSTAIASFSANFYTAVNPQIVKSYASGDKRYMIQLVFKSSKFSFYLLLLISMPLLIELDYILKLWLKEATVDMIDFTRLGIIFVLVNSLENPLTQMARATGDIRRYQIMVGSFTLLTLPASFIFFKLGFPPETTLYVLIAIYVIALFIRLAILRKLVNLPVTEYLSQVLFRVILVSCISAIVPFLFKSYIGKGVLQFFAVIIFSFFWILAVVYFLGVSGNEKSSTISFIKGYFRKIT